MTDQAFATHTIRTGVRKIDFASRPSLSSADMLDAELALALKFLQDPLTCVADIQYVRLRGKQIAQARTYRATLAVRKINENLRAADAGFGDDRRSVVLSLKSVLSETVGFNLYKLDVRQFYESFDHALVVSHLRAADHISNGTRRVVEILLNHHASRGMSGLPRGLCLSSTLSEQMMAPFDSYIESHPEVFFYRRYVDDLTMVTSQREDPAQFLKDVSARLAELSPKLEFKSKKHYQLSAKRFRARDARESYSPKFNTFDYLGYAYNVAVERHKKTVPPGREVWLDIASNKIAKIKTRLIKSYLAYLKDKNFTLLDSRIRHLTSNMSLLDRSRGVRRMIGIHFNYPLVDYDRTVALHELDRFLRNSLTSSKGRVFRKLAATLSATQKASLARHSFFAGAKARHFFQLNVSMLGAVQRCWKYG